MVIRMIIYLYATIEIIIHIYKDKSFHLIIHIILFVLAQVHGIYYIKIVN